MGSTTLRVPDDLLQHPDLSKSAKLLWIVVQNGSRHAATVPRTGLLQARTGLARHTVLRALTELRAQGWLPQDPDRRLPQDPDRRLPQEPDRRLPQDPDRRPPQEPDRRLSQGPDRRPSQGPDRRSAAGEAAATAAHIPADLLSDRQLSGQAKLLYASLQRLAGYDYPQGECSYAGLCQQAGISLNTTKRAIRALQATGWLQLTQQSRFSPIHFLLCNPVASRAHEAVARMIRRLSAAPYRGEALMRAYLSLLFDSDEHDDDASPAFLVNPFTGEEMQFDRYYTAGVAFEFNGAQHYRPTEHYPDELQVLKQQARDYMKQRICAARGIHLVVILPEDLTLARMRSRVQEHFPLRDLTGHEAVVRYLEKLSRGYRRKAREGRLPCQLSLSSGRN